MNFRSGWDSAQNRIPNQRAISGCVSGNTGLFVNNFSIYLQKVIVNRLQKEHYIVVIRKTGAWGCQGDVIFPFYEIENFWIENLYA